MRLQAGWLAIAMGVLLLVGCSPNPTPELPTVAVTNTPEVPTATPPAIVTRTRPTLAPTKVIPSTSADDITEQAYIRIVHAAPGTDALDIYIEELDFATGVEYGQFTLPGEIVAGTYNVSITPANGRLSDSALLSQPVTLAGQETAILLITGARDALRLIVVPENQTPLNADQNRVSVINAIPNSAPVTLLREDNTPLTTPLEFGAISQPNILGVGDYNLGVVANNVELMTVPLDLKGRKNTVLILIGDFTDRLSLKNILFDTNVPGITTLRAGHVVQGLNPVDFYANDRLIAQNVSYANVSTPLELPSGIYDIAAYPMGADITTTTPLSVYQITADPDVIVTLLLLGEPNALVFTLYAEAPAPTAAGYTRVTFVNALPNTTRVDVTSENFTDSLYFAQPTTSIEIPARLTNFIWTDNQGGSELELADIQLQTGVSYLYIFAGRGSSPPFLFANDVGIFDSEVGGLTVTLGATIAPVTPTPVSASYLRVVNAVPGTFVDFYVNESSLFDNVPYTDDTTFFTLSADTHILTVGDDTTPAMGNTELRAQPGEFYTAFVYGDINLGYNIFVTNDRFETTNPDRVHFRLINVSQPLINMGLAYTPANLVTPQTSEVSSEGGEGAATPADGIVIEDDGRTSIPGGLLRILSRVRSGTATIYAMLTEINGPVDLYVLDSDAGEMVKLLPYIELQNGGFYDVVAFQPIGSRRVEAFILPNPGG